MKCFFTCALVFALAVSGPVLADDSPANNVSSINGEGNGTYSGSYTHSPGPDAPHEWFTFCAASAGQTVTIAVSTPGWDSVFWLYDVFDDNAQIGDARTVDFSDAIFGSTFGTTYTTNYSVPAAGQYLMQLDSFVGGSGTYDVTISGASSNALCGVPSDVDIAVAVGENTDPVTAGSGAGNLVHTVNVSNLSANPATGLEVTFSQLLPAGVSLDNTNPSVGTVTGNVWTIGNLAAGATETLTLTMTAGASSLGSATSSATWTALTEPDTNGANDSGAETTGIVASADMSVAKTGPATAVAGTPVTYNIAVTNNGPSDAQSVSVADPTPAGYTFASATAPCAAGFPCAIGTVTSGSTVAFSVTYNIGAATTGDVTNAATVSTITDDPNAANDSASATTAIGAEADMAITKTGPATAAAGTQVTYSITATNNGPSDAQTVSVADPTPAGTTFVSATAPCAGGFPCALGTVANGASVAFDVTFDIDPATTGDVINTATVSTSATDSNAANDSASATTTIGAEADMAITKTGPATAAAGTPVTYSITVTNNGPSDAQTVSVADPTPAGTTFVSATAPCAGGFPCALGTVANGASVAFDVTFDIDPATSGDVTNTATVSTAATDTNAANDSASATTTIGANADLSLTKTVDRFNVQLGDTIVYTLTVSNAGPSDATGVIITDNLPAGQQLVSSSGCVEDPSGVPTCTVGTVAAGATATVNLTVQVVGTTSSQTNTATVDSDTSDPVAANNSASAGISLAFAIPTLGSWGLALMVLLLLAIGVRRSRPVA